MNHGLVQVYFMKDPVMILINGSFRLLNDERYLETISVIDDFEEMMEVKLIIYPGFAVVVLTFLLYTKNRIEVGKEFSEKSIKGSYFKLYQDIPPEHVEISRQTLKN